MTSAVELQNKFFYIEHLANDVQGGEEIRCLAKEGFIALDVPLDDTITIAVRVALGLLGSCCEDAAIMVAVMRAFQGKANPRSVQAEITKQKGNIS